MTTSCMEKMSLEEKRKVAYGDSKKAGRCREEEEKKGSKKAGNLEKDGREKNVWKFWEDMTENLDASKPTNQPEVVQEEENLKNLTEENFNLEREEDCFINMTDSLKFGVKFGRNNEMHEEDRERRRGTKDVTPGKSRKMSEMLRTGACCTAMAMKDAA